MADVDTQTTSSMEQERRHRDRRETVSQIGSGAGSENRPSGLGAGCPTPDQVPPIAKDGGVQFVAPMVGPSGDEPVSAEDLERLNSVVMRRWGHIIYASNMQEVDQFNRRLQSLCREMFGRNLPVELYYAEGLAPAPPEPAMIKWLSTTKLSDRVRSAQGG